MKKVMFINPLNHNRKDPPNNIGLQILDCICKENKFDTDVLDFQLEFSQEKIEFSNHILRWIESKISKCEAKCYGISIKNASFPWAIEIAKIIKKLYPTSIVFVGGPHATALQAEILNTCSDIDYVLVYEGEQTIFNFLNYIEGNITELPVNVLGRDSNSNRSEMTCENIANFHELDYSLYLNTRILDVEVGRGCPFNCYYCSSRMLIGNKVRYKNIDDILNECQQVFDQMNKENRLYVNFNHDNFLSNKYIFSEFASRKIQEKCSFEYGCAGRIDLIDDEVIDLLVKSGCRYIFVGLETGSVKMQKVCRKKLKLSTVAEKVKKITDKGILMEGNFIIGFPEEELNDLYDTIRFVATLLSVSPYIFLNYSHMSPEPQTDVYNNTNIDDYLLLESSQFYKDLTISGLVPENMSPMQNNHLYTIKNKHYDIMEYLDKSRKFFTMIRENYVSIYIFLNILKIDVIDIFENLGKYNDTCELILYYHNQYDDKLSEVEKNLIQYECDRIKIRKEKLHDVRLQYEYPVQKIYQEFYDDQNTCKSWQNRKKEKTEVVRH